MSEDISALMDGEVEADEVEGICRRLRSDEAVQTWACYHLIGDALRDPAGLTAGVPERLAKRLAAEPTVLAPRPPVPLPARTAWAVAASAAAVAVVGWMALTSFAPGDAVQMAASVPASRAGATLPDTQVRRTADLGNYVLVHQEYSPATMIQGVQQYIRAVSVENAPTR